MRNILLTYTNQFNWAYYDEYGENQIGQLGYGFSLILLSKYGQEKRLDTFYAEKYFKAFPQLTDTGGFYIMTTKQYSNRCYSIRTFDRFLDYFGLIKIEEERKGNDTIKYISKTDIFDKLVKCTPHNNSIKHSNLRGFAGFYPRRQVL